MQKISKTAHYKTDNNSEGSKTSNTEDTQLNKNNFQRLDELLDIDSDEVTNETHIYDNASKLLNSKNVYDKVPLYDSVPQYDMVPIQNDYESVFDTFCTSVPNKNVYDKVPNSLYDSVGLKNTNLKPHDYPDGTYKITQQDHKNKCYTSSTILLGTQNKKKILAKLKSLANSIFNKNKDKSKGLSKSNKQL